MTIDIKTLRDELGNLDCGDNSCCFGGSSKGGMRTNGGCTCHERLRTGRLLRDLLPLCDEVERLQVEIAESERQRDASLAASVLHETGYEDEHARCNRLLDENSALKVRVQQLESHIRELEEGINTTVERWSEETGDGSMWGADAYVLAPIAEISEPEQRSCDEYRDARKRVIELERQQAGYQSDYDELTELVPKGPASVVSRVVERVGELEGALRDAMAIIGANRLMLGEYCGPQNVANIELRARKALEGGTT